MSLNIQSNVAMPQNQMIFRGKEQCLKNTIKDNITAYTKRAKDILLDNPPTLLYIDPKNSKNKLAHTFDFGGLINSFIANNSGKLMESDKLMKIVKKLNKLDENLTALKHSFFSVIR